MKNKNLKGNVFIDNLLESFSEAYLENEETVQELLREEGIEPDDSMKEGLHFIRSIERETRLEIARAKHSKLLQSIKEFLLQSKDVNKDKLKEYLMRYFSKEKKSETFATLFRQLDSIKEEDLSSILEDVKILEIIEKLHNENKDY